MRANIIKTQLKAKQITKATLDHGSSKIRKRTFVFYCILNGATERDCRVPVKVLMFLLVRKKTWQAKLEVCFQVP